MTKNACILFRGDLLDGEEKTEVLARFSGLFSVSPSQVEPFFDDGAVFFRGTLDLPTARKYYSAFHKIGARAYVGISLDAFFQCPGFEKLKGTPVATCPSCNTWQIFGSECVYCHRESLQRIVPQQEEGTQGGIAAAGPVAAVKKSKAEAGTAGDMTLSSAIAKRAYSSAGILMLVLILFQEYIAWPGSFPLPLMAEGRALSGGANPYSVAFFLLATLAITYGSWHYVRTKGYRPLFALLGLGNIPGLGILVLLPHRLEPGANTPYLNAHRVAAIIMIALFLGWVTV